MLEKLNRRAFLATLNALPFVGRVMPKPAERNPARIMEDMLNSAGHAVDRESFDACAAFCEEEIPFTVTLAAARRLAKTRIQEELGGAHNRVQGL